MRNIPLRNILLRNIPLRNILLRKILGQQNWKDLTFSTLVEKTAAKSAPTCLVNFQPKARHLLHIAFLQEKVGKIFLILGLKSLNNKKVF